MLCKIEIAFIVRKLLTKYCGLSGGILTDKFKTEKFLLKITELFL